MRDFYIQNEGSIVLFEPVTDAAKKWVEENVQLEGWQWLGPSFAVDHRFAEDLINGITADGLVVEGPNAIHVGI